MTIEWNRKRFRVMVERTSLDRSKERFEIHGKNRILHVESNRPALEHKNLHNWVPTYRVTSPRIQTPGFEKAMLETLHFHLMAYKENRKDM